MIEWKTALCRGRKFAPNSIWCSNYVWPTVPAEEKWKMFCTYPAHSIQWSPAVSCKYILPSKLKAIRHCLAFSWCDVFRGIHQIRSSRRHSAVWAPGHPHLGMASSFAHLGPRSCQCANRHLWPNAHTKKNKKKQEQSCGHCRLKTKLLMNQTFLYKLHFWTFWSPTLFSSDQKQMEIPSIFCHSVRGMIKLSVLMPCKEELLCCFRSEEQATYDGLPEFPLPDSCNCPQKIWKISNHKRDLTRRWCIPEIPNCNMPSGQSCKISAHRASELVITSSDTSYYLSSGPRGPPLPPRLFLIMQFSGDF